MHTLEEEEEEDSLCDEEEEEQVETAPRVAPSLSGRPLRRGNTAGSTSHTRVPQQHQQAQAASANAQEIYFSHYDTAEFNTRRVPLGSLQSKKALEDASATAPAEGSGIGILPIRKKFKRRRVDVKMHYTGVMVSEEELAREKEKQELMAKARARSARKRSKNAKNFIEANIQNVVI